MVSALDRRLTEEMIATMSMNRIAIVAAMSKEGSEYFQNMVNEMRGHQEPVKDLTGEDLKNMGFEVRNG